ncbi:MAG: putative metalloprotease with PDZ domain, partial [Kiritimatiellia bacterium]
CRDLKVICEGHLDLLGAPPEMDRYLFQLMVVGSGYGGLEHRASTSLICGRADLPRVGQDKISAGYRTLLALSSHEYFHTWNVKRIKPAVFLPYDLSKETNTTLLWAFEGITSYYEPLGLIRTKVIEPDVYLELVGRRLSDVTRRPGRYKQSVADSSFDAWTKFYKQDENSSNAIVSYYSKGAMVALALDLTIRRDTDGARSLDDVMRALWERYGKPGIGVPESGVEDVATETSGLDLRDFFDNAVRGTGDIELTDLLQTFGVRLSMRPREGAKDRGGKPGSTSLETAMARGHLGVLVRANTATVQSVIDDGPAMRAGLSAGDVLIAMNDIKVGTDVLDRVAELNPGTTVQIHAFRRDQLMRFDVQLSAPPCDTVALSIDPDADEQAVARRRTWMYGA